MSTNVRYMLHAAVLLSFAHAVYHYILSVTATCFATMLKILNEHPRSKVVKNRNSTKIYSIIISLFFQALKTMSANFKWI